MAATNAANHQVEVILNDHTEWAYFIQNVKAQAYDHDIWNKIDPNLTTQPALTQKPAKPTGNITQMDATQMQRLKLQQDEYRFDYSDWQKEASAMASIHKYIREHITLPNHDIIADSTTVWGTLRKLKERCEPTDEAKLLELKMQWNRLINMDVKSQDWKMVLDKISVLYGKMVKEGIVIFKAGTQEPTDKLLLIEALNLIARIDRTFADTKRANLKDPNYYIKNVPSLVIDFRDYMNTKPLRRAQGKESMAYNAEGENGAHQFQGQGPNGKKQNTLPECYCGRKHQSATCYYCLSLTGEKDKVPSDFKLSKFKLDKVKEAFKDPKIKAKFKADRSSYLSHKKEEPKPSTATDEEEVHTFQTTFENWEDEAVPVYGNGKTCEVATAFSTMAESEAYYFTNAWILDGGSEKHVCNSPLRNEYRKTGDAPPNHFVRCGLTRYRIESYGSVTLRVMKADGGYAKVIVTDVALCPYFRTNLISTSKWESKGLHLITLDGGYICPSTDVTKKMFLPQKHRMFWCMEFNPPSPHEYAQDPRESNVYTSQHVRQTKPEQAIAKLLTSTAEEDKWHQRLGHPGPQTMAHLPKAVEGNVKIHHTPNTKQCEVCSLSKAHQIVSRSNFKETPSTRPFQRICYDLIPMTRAYNGHKYLSHFHCDWSMFEFVFTHRKKNDCIRCFQYIIAICRNIFKQEVQIFQTDGEASLGKETSEINAFWDTIRKNGILVHQSAPHTQAQNGAAEAIGKHIIIGMRCNRIQSGQPESLWPEHAKATVVQNNRKPVQKLNWITPYEAAHGVKPAIFHLVVYGAKGFVLNKEIPKLQRLDPRAFIGYLVGYEGTNIYRVWIPSQKKVIRTRDVVFDEEDHIYNPTELDSLIIYPEAVENHLIVAPVPIMPEAEDLIDDIDVSDILPDRDLADTQQPEIRGSDTDKSDEDGMTIPSSSRGGTADPSTRATSVGTAVVPLSQPKKPSQGKGWMYGEAKATRDISSTENLTIPDGTKRTRKRPSRFDNHSFYTTVEEGNVSYANAFLTLINVTKQHRDDLPTPPEDYEEARKSPLWPQWRQACLAELKKMEEKSVYTQISHTKDLTPRPIPLKWVFDYKFDSSGILHRFKARLCVRGDKQPLNGLDTYAATLAAEVMRFLLALAAHFDLEMRQYDAITAFLNADLDERIHTMPPPGFGERGQVWQLKKALYGLRRSPHLWHTELSGYLQSIGILPIPGVNCLHHNDWLVVFFFVDDIICLYRKQHQSRFDVFEHQLSAKYELRMMGEPEHFLGIGVTRDRVKQSITLCQEAYIKKITKRFQGSLFNRTVYTPLPSDQLTKNDGNATAAQVTEMQEKVGSIGYAAYITRWDVAFAASLLAEFQLNPSEAHINAANHCLTYLRDRAHYAITYTGIDTTQEHLISHTPFMDVSADASFADDVDTRKSRQGYMMKMANGAVAWKANKQRTVTTSSTEAELLAASQVAKEVLWWKRLFKDINFQLQETITIKCDNRQTIRLLKEEAAQLTTKLRHVDIHHHWLRQEIQAETIAIEHVPTAQQGSDGLTKAMTRQKQEEFLKQGNMQMAHSQSKK
jgi:hypothetical protein